ncbi:adenylyl-sulfate kinase [Halarsenatibacter silvermanii]|uniref:Adenylyl-sulfate kinase n=1 Tax=Halarsenatibacter silvermanii TaxID=321763 RepID=A0A1G9TY08_9FIRM|nr:adenylyl-sulfate kinase [Halarsenatibacter silvermanii]SDM52562.1 adenylylsulfate kinase [Halarsenatibacter silvermanii]
MNQEKPENIYETEGKVSFQQRCDNLNQTGQVLWFTGLSASGKSTIAIELEKRLVDSGKAVYRLDGDNIRSGLNKDLGFTPEDRDENIRRVAELAALFKDAGLITLVSFISPYQEKRDFARELVGDKYFHEIYVKARVETCEERDPKGLYEQARKGEIENFTGISAPYEEPEDPELVLDTDKFKLEECVKKARALLA